MVPESVKKADSLGKRLDLLEMRLEDDIEKQNRAISLIFSEVRDQETKSPKQRGKIIKMILVFESRKKVQGGRRHAREPTQNSGCRDGGR